MTLRPGALISVAEARHLLPVSRSALYRLLASGAIAAVRRPGLPLLVVRESLERYVAGPPAPEPLDVDGLLARIREQEP